MRSVTASSGVLLAAFIIGASGAPACDVAEVVPLGDEAPEGGNGGADAAEGEPLEGEPPEVEGHSVDFIRYNGDRPTEDRIVISLDAPPRAADVGAGDFTVEFWMRVGGNNPENTTPCDASAVGWQSGAVLVDRSVVAGDEPHPSFGVAVFTDAVGAGVDAPEGGVGLCGETPVTDTLWHHVAFTRELDSGMVRLFVDGHLEREALGPTTDLSYRDGRPPEAELDSYLVLGASKTSEDAATAYDGLLDELRISSSVRYAADFQPEDAAFEPDAETAALYHFDESTGAQVLDASETALGPAHGVRRSTARGEQTSFHAGP